MYFKVSVFKNLYYFEGLGHVVKRMRLCMERIVYFFCFQYCLKLYKRAVWCCLLRFIWTINKLCVLPFVLFWAINKLPTVLFRLNTWISNSIIRLESINNSLTRINFYFPNVLYYWGNICTTSFLHLLKGILFQCWYKSKFVRRSSNIEGILNVFLSISILKITSMFFILLLGCSFSWHVRGRGPFTSLSPW